MTAERYPHLARGMVATLQRVNRGQPQGVTLEQLLAVKEAEITRLQTALEVARAKIARLEAGESASPTDDDGPPSRHLVSQVEAAAILHVKPYTISRWVKAGHFRMVTVPGRVHALIDASSLHIPPRKKRSK